MGLTVKPRIAFIINGIAQGGAELMTLKIAGGLADFGYPVEVVIIDSDSVRQKVDISPKVKLVSLGCSSPASIWNTFYLNNKYGLWKFLYALPAGFLLWFRLRNALLGYMRRNNPYIIFTSHCNSPTLAVTIFMKNPPKVVIIERINFAAHFKNFGFWVNAFYYKVCRFFYHKADEIVGVSNGVLKGLREDKLIAADKGICINNLVEYEININTTNAISAKVLKLFDKKHPVVLAVGRLDAQKNYPLLLKSFALLSRKREIKLVILGDGSQETKNVLIGLIEQLGIENDVIFEGFVKNVFPYMHRSDVMALSSSYEGFGNVLIEALACGTTIVSTDCPYGPREILDNGKYGYLVPVNDETAFAEAIEQALDHPLDKDLLRQRARMFSKERNINEYDILIKRMLNLNHRTV